MKTNLKKPIASLAVLALVSALPVQASVGIAQSPTNTLTNGLVGYWTFDGKDTNWKTGQITDRSGQGNTGQITGIATTSVAVGKAGQSLQFFRNTSSATQYVTVQDSTSLSQTGSNSFTVSFWVKPSVLCDGTNQNYVEKAQDSATPGWGLYMQGSCSLNARLAYTGSRVDVTVSAANVLANFATSTWTHVVFVVNRSTNLAQWYLNGKAIGSPTNISSLGDMTNTRPVDISAGRQGLGVNTIGGSMDDIRIYSRAFSAQEIAQLYVSDGGTIAQSQTNTLTNGLVGYWTLDGRDTNWKTGVESDRSAQGNTCVLKPGLATTTTVALGKIGQSFTFTGSDTGYLDCGNITAFQTNQQTLVAWIKTSNAGVNFRSIVAKSLAFGMYLVNNVLGTYDNGTSQTRVSAGLLNDNKWHQVAIAFNSGVTNGTFMYVDSVLVASTTVTITNSAQVIKIGYGQSSGQVFSGQIDDVRVYNRQLSTQEIAQLYKNGGGTIAQSNATMLVNGLVGYWPLDGSTLNWKTGQVADKSGQGNNGALISMSTSTSVALGKIGQALKFDGVAGYINVGGNTILKSIINNATMSAWIKPTTVASQYKIISSPAGGLAFGTLGTGLIFTVGGVKNYTSSTITLPTNTWSLVTATIDGNNNVSFYVNGIYKETIVGVGNGSASTSGYSIGSNGGSSQFFPGTLDDVRVYSRALSAQEIAQLYASTK